MKGLFNRPIVLLSCLSIALLLTWAGASSLNRPTDPNTETAGPLIAIKDATLYPMNRPPFRGDLLFKGSRILAIGTNIDIPSEARIIDAKGKPVTPGIALANTTLGLVEISLEKSTRNTSTTSKSPVHPSFQVINGYNPHSVTVPVARIEGITTTMIQPLGGLVSGQSALVDLWGVGQYSLRPSLAVHATIQQGNTAYSWRVLKELLDDARFYRNRLNAYNKGEVRSLIASRLDLLSMLPVLNKTTPLVLNVNRAVDILHALKFAKQQHIRLILQGAAEGWQVAKQIAAAKIPVILGPPRNLPYNFNILGSRYDNAALLHKAGVLFAMGMGGGSHHIRGIRQEAGIAVAWGLPKNIALRSITSHLFKIFRLQHIAGTLEPGKRADIVLWTGDPLELSTLATQVWIRGQAIPMKSRQTLLRDRYIRFFQRHP